VTQEIGLRDVLAQVNARLDRLEREVEALRAEMQTQFLELHRRQDAHFRWILGIMIGVMVPMWVSLIVALFLRT